MIAEQRRPRGRPRRIERDIALVLAVEWFRRVESLSTNKAAHAVTSIWQSLGRSGLGRPGAQSKAIYRSIGLAAEHLGEGRFLVLHGVEVAGKLIDAACFFVPTGSTLGQAQRGRSPAIHGPAWRWSFGAPEAELLAVKTSVPG